MNKQELLHELKLKTETITLKSGKEVIVSEISAADYMKMWQDCSIQKEGSDEVSVDMIKFTPSLLAYSIVDENGNRIFTDEDIPLLARSAQGPFSEIAHAAKRINGMIGDEGNDSEPTPTGSSSGE